MPDRIFLLSPANSGGKRARMLFNERAQFDLALKLRFGGASIGEIYTFISGLYFRGKMAYAQAFTGSPEGLPGAYVITPGRGLMPLDTIVGLDDLQQMAQVSIDASEALYR